MRTILITSDGTAMGSKLVDEATGTNLDNIVQVVPDALSADASQPWGGTLVFMQMERYKGEKGHLLWREAEVPDERVYLKVGGPIDEFKGEGS